jgi:hypothetical protein
MHESNFHVKVFSYGSNAHDVMGRVNRSRAASDVAATATSRWILAATASSRPSRLEFQYSSLTFRAGILAADMGTSSWRASRTMGNAFVDDTDAATTFFFTTDGKSFVHTFNCSIRNTRKCRTTCLLVYLCLQSSFLIAWARLHQWGSKYGRIRRGRRRWHQQ